jgi:deoxyribodipyrimidine photo-lyase
MHATRPKLVIFWHRRDLRLHDNAGLYQALKHAQATNLRVLPLFIFDCEILDKLRDKADRRVVFIHQALLRMQTQLHPLGARMEVAYGLPLEVWPSLLEKYEVEAVFTNRDYEPYAQARDKAVYELLKARGIPFHGAKDHVIFEKTEILSGALQPYTVYTPYKNRWLATLTPEHLAPRPSETLFDHLCRDGQTTHMPSLADMGFAESESAAFPAEVVPDSLIEAYGEQRNFPSRVSTSRLGVHLRFGTISIRALARKAQSLSDTFLAELIWRDFYQQVLYNFPQVATQALKPAYDTIAWRGDAKAQEDFTAWCTGQTGYPIVDAGMRELNATGFMHNRVRMIVANFLTKHLLLDWHWGEAYFAEKLLDFDLASNNGGWQWAAGSGCDAQPYFRIFNPYEQTRKFDPDLAYIRQWVPEFEQTTYPKPIVEHTFARNRALAVYKAAVGKAV